MNRAALVLSAATLDAILGDPEHLPHPVRFIGKAIDNGETILRSEARSETYKLIAGATLTATLVVTAYTLTATLIRLTHRVHWLLGDAVELVLASTCLAARNLDDEARGVLAALPDLPVARRRIARIVGRDTASLDEHGISRALIETLAESACDGIAAPLFYLTLGGVPAAMAFKTISTLDSMIGHRTERYLYFGKAAARLDDLANYLPARLTAFVILATSGRRLAPALAVYRRDKSAHASPNAGHPEAAMAGVLGVELGGPSSYDGIAHQAPILGRGHPLPTPADARRALQITRAVSVCGVLAALAFLTLKPRRNA